MANRDTLVDAVVKFVEVDYGSWQQGGVPFVGTAISGVDEILPADMTFTVEDIVYAATYLGERYGTWTNHSYAEWYSALVQNLSARMTTPPPVIPPVIPPVPSSSKILLIIGGLALLYLLTKKTGEG